MRMQNDSPVHRESHALSLTQTDSRQHRHVKLPELPARQFARCWSQPERGLEIRVGQLPEMEINARLWSSVCQLPVQCIKYCDIEAGRCRD